MIVNNVEAKHILTKSKLPGLGYCVNPYTGCQHACVYCYARFMKRFSNHEEPWGTFVDVKINADELFAKDFKKTKPGEGAFFGSVTDCYQPFEAQYKLTRSILQQIADQPERHFYPTILTKSDLVQRDADLLKRITGASVGFSIALMDEEMRRLFEPGCSPIAQRLAALRALSDEGISTYAFIGPILPGFTDLHAIFSELEGIVSEVHGETLNTSCGNMPQILRTISVFDRHLYSDFYRKIYSRPYWEAVEEQFYTLAKKHHIPVAGFYHHIKPKQMEKFIF